MPSIEVVRSEALTRRLGVERLPVSDRQKLADADRQSSIAASYFGSECPLSLSEVTVESDVAVRPHAHVSAEILYVVEGELRLGSQVCPPGTAVFIDAETLYGFRSGQSGVRFLTFRSGAADYLSREALRERRMAHEAGRSAGGRATAD